MEQPEMSEIFIAVTFGGYKTDFNLNSIIVTLTLYFLGKESTSECYQSVACQLNSCYFFIVCYTQQRQTREDKHKHCATDKLRQIKRHGGNV